MAVLAPQCHEYRTDGVALFEILGLDDRGRYECEDVVTFERRFLTPDAIALWRLVEPADDLARA